MNLIRSSITVAHASGYISADEAKKLEIGAHESVGTDRLKMEIDKDPVGLFDRIVMNGGGKILKS
jgi:hypothetical protein